jgi:hypothetical protein
MGSERSRDSGAGFLNWELLTLGTEKLFVVGLSCASWMFTRISGFTCYLPIAPTSPVMITKMSPDFSKCPW